MSDKISQYLENTIHLILLTVAFFVPIVFINLTTDFYEFPKLAFLTVATLIMLGLWIFSWIAKNKIVIFRTPLDIPLLVLLFTVIASTLLSPSRFPSIFGSFPRIHGSAISWVVYILLYFITASNLNTASRIKNIIYVLLGSSALVALIGLMAYFKIYLPFEIAKNVNFTPTGSTFSTLALLLTLLPISLFAILRPGKFISPPIAAAIATIFSIQISLTGTIPALVTLFIIFALSLLISNPKHAKNISLFALPLSASVLLLILSYLPFPGNVFQAKRALFPQEIQLPLAISWKISASAFRDAPFIGTGPGTYLFNFTAYKPAEFNRLNLWSLSFDTAHNEFLLILATLGLVGFSALVSILLLTTDKARRQLVSAHDWLPGLALASLSGLVLLFLHPSTLVSQVSLFIVFASLFMSSERSSGDTAEISLGLKAGSKDKYFDLFPIILFIVYIIGAVPAFYYTYRTVLADIYHRKALVVARTSGNQTYTNLQKAESLNPYIDLYRIDMAQTNFILANEIASQKGPSAASPSGSLTNDDRQTLQTLLTQAVTEARVAVALSPLSARNYEILASIYRNIAGVSQNALVFSLDAYGKAIQRDPLNPMLRLNAGGVYYSVKNYDLAVRFFTDAVNLKNDYANAYYNLAIALRDKGDLQNAKTVAEQTMALMKQEIKDPNDINYKRAAELLADLTAKVPDKTTTQPGLTEPAAVTPAPVNQLPIQTDLGTPPEISTPSAITR